MDVDGPLGSDQGLRTPAEVGKAVAVVIQAHREIGEEGVGPVGEAAVSAYAGDCDFDTRPSTSEGATTLAWPGANCYGQ
jgi:hypothetical protein